MFFPFFIPFPLVGVGASRDNGKIDRFELVGAVYVLVSFIAAIIGAAFNFVGASIPFPEVESRFERIADYVLSGMLAGVSCFATLLLGTIIFFAFRMVVRAILKTTK